MQIFHYVAHKVQNCRNFECGNGIGQICDSDGAVYNTFDFDSSKVLQVDEVNFTQTSNICGNEVQ